MCELFNEQCSSDTRKNISEAEESLRHLFSKKLSHHIFSQKNHLPRRWIAIFRAFCSHWICRTVGCTGAGFNQSFSIRSFNFEASLRIQVPGSGIQFPGSSFQDPGFNLSKTCGSKCSSRSSLGCSSSWSPRSQPYIHII